MGQKDQLLETVCARIRARLDALDWTAERAGRESLGDRKAIKKIIEQGIMPGLPRLSAIADALGCSVAYLIGETDTEKPGDSILGATRHIATAEPGPPRLYRTVTDTLASLEDIDRATIRALRELALGDDSARVRLARLDRAADMLRRNLVLEPEPAPAGPAASPPAVRNVI